MNNAYTVHYNSHGGRLIGFSTYEAAEAWALANYGEGWAAWVSIR